MRLRRQLLAAGCMLLLSGLCAQSDETKLPDLFHLYRLDHAARVEYCVQKSYKRLPHKDPACVLFSMELGMSTNAWFQQISFCSDQRDVVYMTERPEHWERMKQQLVDVYGFDAPFDETGKEQRFQRDSSVIVFASTPGEGHLVNHYVQIKRLFEEATTNCVPSWDTTSYHALIIAVEKYQFDGKGIDNLEWPVSEAKDLAKILKNRYGFTVDVLENPDHKTMVQAFEALRGLTCNDHLLVFFAGHGVYDSGTRKGYWLPTDADPHVHSDHFSSTDIIDQLAVQAAGHVLVISDACYGGAIFNENNGYEDLGTRMVDEDLRVLAAKPSRQVMTSGKIERVPDRSVFFNHLLGALENNTHKYWDVAMLYSTVLQDIKDDRLEHPEQVIPAPQFGFLKGTNDRKGSMILRLKGK